MTPEAGLVLGGRYELISRIAVGGMGEVWTAMDLHLHRRVAAKVLRAEFAGDKAFLDRLRAEARNSAALSHQNIAAIYDYGEQVGSGYLIMELVHGEPLAELLARERTLEPAQLLPILGQTARALHTAHMAGVVHRDVKPSNILITADGHVKITDFGISVGSNQAPMTAAGMVMGTAQYLPPEQAMGRAATGAGDIYALGVVAYEALAGRRPFTGSTQVDIAFAHVNQPVPPLPDVIDVRVRDVVMQMLDKDPERRPRSAASLARMLEELAGRLGVTAGPRATPDGGPPDGGPPDAVDVTGAPLPSTTGGPGPASAGAPIASPAAKTPDATVPTPAKPAVATAPAGAPPSEPQSVAGVVGTHHAGEPPDAARTSAPDAARATAPDAGRATAIRGPHAEESGNVPHDDPPVRWRLTRSMDVGAVTPVGPTPLTRRAVHPATARTPGVHRRRTLAAHTTLRGMRLLGGWVWAAGLVLGVALLTLVLLWLSRLGDTAAGVAVAAPMFSASTRRAAGSPRVKER